MEEPQFSLQLQNFQDLESDLSLYKPMSSAGPWSKAIQLASTLVRALAQPGRMSYHQKSGPCKIFYSSAGTPRLSSSKRPLVEAADIYFSIWASPVQLWISCHFGILIVSFFHLTEALFLSTGLDVCVSCLLKCFLLLNYMLWPAPSLLAGKARYKSNY